MLMVLGERIELSSSPHLDASPDYKAGAQPIGQPSIITTYHNLTSMSIIIFSSIALIPIITCRLAAIWTESEKDSVVIRKTRPIERRLTFITFKKRWFHCGIPLIPFWNEHLSLLNASHTITPLLGAI